MNKPINILEEPALTYHTFADQDLFHLIDAIRKGIQFNAFTNLLNQFPFSLNEWSVLLGLSERTMQRYQKEKKTFDQSASEKIMEIVLIYRYGVQVFLSKDKFNQWLETKNLALGNHKPKELLDNSFGINLLKDELFRIEQGILA